MGQAEEKSKSAPADKPKYTAPKVLPLGELTRGSGDCEFGSAHSLLCASGQTATLYCNTGGNFA
jgi:hypothetical protein